MKKFIAVLGTVVFLISGCSFDVQVVTPMAPTPAPTAQVVVVSDELPTVPVPPVLPAFTPSATEPVFYQAFVAATQSAGVGQVRFPAGIKQIYAVWQYKNMRAGLTVRREWRLNGQVWLTREEPWDFAKYGESGTLRDISIYDLDAGLPSGKYQLSVAIDGLGQPIGQVFTDAPPSGVIEFEILSQNEVTSPNGVWKATSLVTRLVVSDTTGKQADVYTGREIISMAWVDDQHLLFVDRDRSGQVSRDLLIGVRDELLSVDLVKREVRSLYQSSTALGSTGGLYPAPNGRYVAGIEGSGFGDACMLDAQVIFFALTADYQSAQVLKQAEFAGIPAAPDSVVYPVAVGEWQTATQYVVPLNRMCTTTDSAVLGLYQFDLVNEAAQPQAGVTATLSVGDLGWGDIHGRITDAVTGSPIAGAVVTCEHHSYTSPVTCAGSVTTIADGTFRFERIFFHDTDTVKLTVRAAGYQPVEISQAAFTMPGLEVNTALNYPP